MLAGIKTWAAALAREVMALWLAARDRRVPWGAKAVAALVSAYALSPIDLIPDFVPVLGYLDDLLIVPAGIWLAVRLVPPTLMAEFREGAKGRVRPVSRSGLLLIALTWLAVGALLWWRLI